MLRGQYSQAAAAASARLGAALRVAAAHGREAQVALLAGVSTAMYVLTQPPTALWAALSGMDFLAGVALLAASQLAALMHGRATTTMRVTKDAAARSAERAVRRAALLDAATCIAAPWVAMALGFATSSAAFCAPQFWFCALALLARAAADVSAPAGATRTAGAFAAAFDALRLLALLRLASPAGGVAAMLQLAACAAACHAAFVARCGAELPAMAAARSPAREAQPAQRKAAKQTTTGSTPPLSTSKGPETTMPEGTPPAATDAVSPRRAAAADAASEVRSPRDDDEKEWAMPSRKPREDDAAAAEQAVRVTKEALRAVTAEEGAAAAKKREP